MSRTNVRKHQTVSIASQSTTAAATAAHGAAASGYTAPGVYMAGTAASGQGPPREHARTLSKAPPNTWPPVLVDIGGTTNCGVLSQALSMSDTSASASNAACVNPLSSFPTNASRPPRQENLRPLCLNYLNGRCSNPKCHRRHVSPTVATTIDTPCSPKAGISAPPGPLRQPLIPSNMHTSRTQTTSVVQAKSTVQHQTLHIPSDLSTPKPSLDPPKPSTSGENEGHQVSAETFKKLNRRGRIPNTPRSVKPDVSNVKAPDVTSQPPVSQSVTESSATKDVKTSSSGSSSEVLEGQVCYEFFRDRCRDGPRCHKRHPPRYEWYKYMGKSTEPCRAYAMGYCYLGENCYRYHPPQDTNAAPKATSQNGAAEDDGPRPRKDRPAETREKVSSKDSSATQSSQKRKKKQANISSSMKQDSASVKSGLTEVSENARGKRRQSQAQASNPKPSRSTDGSSSDTTFYSMNSSAEAKSLPPRGTAQPSVASCVNGPAPVRRSREACHDFLRGRCMRTDCKYSHGDDSDNLTRLLRTLEDSRRNTAAPTASTNAPANVASSTMKVPLKEGRLHIPSVPPGLGLEDTGGSNARRPAREPLWTVPVDVAEVTFGPGFEVKDIRTGFESRRIVLKNVHTSMDLQAVQEILAPFGDVQDIQFPDPKPTSSHMIVRAAYATHTEAAAAVSALDGARVKDGDLSVQLASHKSTGVGKGIVSDGDVYIDFPAPCRTGYIGFSTEEKAQKVVSAIRGKVKGGVRLHAVRYEGLPKVGRYNVRILGLPTNMRIQDLAEFGHDEEAMLDPVPSYRSVEDAAAQLQVLLERYGELISIYVRPPPFHHQTVRAWAHFTSPTAAENACAELNGRRRFFLDGGRLRMYHLKSIAYRLPQTVFTAIERDLLALRARKCPSGERCHIGFMKPNTRHGQNPDAPYTVKLMAGDLSVLNDLKSALEEVLRGEKVILDGQDLWDPFFDRREGTIFLQDIEQRYDMLVNKDARRRTINLFGPLEKRQAAGAAIVAQVRFLRAQTVHAIPMEGRLIGLFMSEDMMKLQQEIGHENVVLDLSKKVLKVRGDDDVLHVTEDILRRVKQRHVLERCRQGNECPVCFDEVTLRSRPVTLGCGHSWCKDCLINYMLASVDTRVFPLKCLGDEARCAHTISLDIARDILPSKDYASVARAAFLTYIQSKPSEFHYCPTPDCSQIYRRAPPDTVLQCPSCLVRICGNCHVEYHEGSFCPDRDTEDKKLFEDWTKSHDVKNCPGCNATIERAAGCNHMTCTRCKTHICWVCLSTFSRGEEVYDHMHIMHGGLGL